MSADYAGQTEGINQFNVPYIAGQTLDNCVRGDDWQDSRTHMDDNVTVSVDNYRDVLSALGFSSVEDMIAAAART
ncbi:MAG: hypothetical protein HC828_03350 [Blastochloris sp.]|nr:hypothetical protein [Blastochloris sp.]